MRAPIEKWGKDHWTTFMYIEVMAANHGGRAVPDRERMRCDPRRHPGLTYNRGYGIQDGGKYPTRLKGGEQLTDHDDWDCLDDLAEAGLLQSCGTSTYPLYKLTPLGREIVNQIRDHKSQGKRYADFTPRLPTATGEK